MEEELGKQLCLFSGFLTCSVGGTTQIVAEMSVVVNEIYENAKLAREQALMGNYEM